MKSIVVKFTFNPFQENTYLVVDNGTKECIIIDPGCSNLIERNALKNYITQNSLNPKYVLNTHCHLDHIYGNAWACREYGIQLYANSLEQTVLNNAELSAKMYDMPIPDPCTIDFFLEDGGVLKIGTSSFKIFHTPGHSPGHLVFYNESDGYVINGDVLFRESIGRSDLPGGNHNQLINSIRKFLFTLPDNTLVYTGHGIETTIGYEKLNNPFLA
ncbi:MAG: MBL fold metallo-hydrolase [Bacteroidota bacterium]|nr:MBL fold metallo-hydrolase [Bacteroidota bacterium]